MASETIKEFLVGIGFDVDSSGLDNLNQKVKKFSLGIAAVVAGAAAGFYAVSKAVTSTAQKFDDLGDAANRIGTTTEELEKFAYIAELSGSNMETAKVSLEMFGRRVGEVAQGTGRAVEIFESLGIETRGASGEMRDTTAILGDVGTAIKDLSRAEQLNILNKLGLDATLLDTLTTDVSGLAAEFDALYKANGINISKTAENAGAFNDMLFRAKYTFESFKNALAGEVLAPLADTAYSITKRFTEFMATTVRHIQPFVRRVAGFIGGLVKVFGRVLTGIVALIRGIVRPFAQLFSLMPTWAKWVAGLTLAFKGLTIAFAATPIGAVVALGVAIAALVDDYLVWKEQGQSFLDWSAWEPAINSAKAAIESFIEIFQNLFGIIFSVFGIIKNLLTLNFSEAWNQWLTAVKSLTSAFGSLFDVIKNVGQFLGNLAGGALDILKGVLPSSFQGIMPAGKGKILADVKNAGGGQTNNVQVKTDIIVQGASDPNTTAKMVADKQAKTLGNAVRDNTAGAM